MDGERFDRFAKTLVRASPRRAVLRLLVGGALGAVAWRSGGEAAAARCGRLGSVCTTQRQCCTRRCVQYKSGSCTRNGKPSGKCRCGCTRSAHCPDGQVCQNLSCAPCHEFILSGGVLPTDRIGVDDNLTIYLNDHAIRGDGTGQASQLSPIRFSANIEDRLRIVATDVNPACRGLSPLLLHCAAPGLEPQVITNGVASTCGPNRQPGVFLDIEGPIRVVNGR